MTRPFAFVLKFTAALLACASTSAGAETLALADTVFLHGKILTLDAAATVVRAVAVKDGRILTTGSDASMRKLTGSPDTQRVRSQSSGEPGPQVSRTLD